MFKKISKLTAGLALGALLLTSCAKDAELLDITPTNAVTTSVQATDIVGTWDASNDNGSVTFNQNGTGSASSATFVSGPLQVTSQRNFTWSLAQGANDAQVITITYQGQEPSTITVESMSASAAKFDGDLHTRSTSGVE